MRKQSMKLLAGTFMLVMGSGVMAEDVLIKEDFNTKDRAGLLQDWNKYGKVREGNSFSLIDQQDGKALLLKDVGTSTEIGLYRTVSAKANKHYKATLKVKKSGENSGDGAFLQLRFLPSNKEVQVPITPKSTGEYSEIVAEGTSPKGTNKVMVFLYTWSKKTPQVIVDDFTLTESLPLPKVVVNDNFNANKDGDALPAHWELYGSTANGNFVKVVKSDDGNAVLIGDASSTDQVGLIKYLGAEGEVYYRAKLKVKKHGDNSCVGGYLGMRFSPKSHSVFAPLSALSSDTFNEIVLAAKAPKGTNSVIISIYGDKKRTIKVLVDDFKLESSVNKF